MTTLKSFTSLKQSRKLAEILPLESADMHLTNSSIKGEMYVDEFKPVLVPYLRAKDSLDAYSKIVNNMIAWEVIPCWSLAALLNILPYPSLHKTFSGWRCDSYNKEGNTCMLGESADNQIDACYELILKLHELNLL